jgi:hypothetical protein
MRCDIAIEGQVAATERDHSRLNPSGSLFCSEMVAIENGGFLRLWQCGAPERIRTHANIQGLS